MHYFFYFCRRVPKITMKWFKKHFKKITNFYILTLIYFIIWMLFFDRNDVFNQFWLIQRYHDLNEEKKYFLEKIKEVKNEREQLFSSNELLEKFARERYLMHKPSEDVYIVKIED